VVIRDLQTGQERIIAESPSATGMAVSPDGKLIAVTTLADGREALAVMRSLAEHAGRSTSRAGALDPWSWVPDLDAGWEPVTVQRDVPGQRRTTAGARQRR